MKLTRVTILLFTLCGALSINANARKVTQHDYTATCKQRYPLYTQDECSRDSYYGKDALDCAKEDAMSECEQGPNEDCIPAGGSVWEVSSIEFVGFKHCFAKYKVHGYGN